MFFRLLHIKISIKRDLLTLTFFHCVSVTKRDDKNDDVTICKEKAGSLVIGPEYENETKRKRNIMLETMYLCFRAGPKQVVVITID